MKRRKGGKEERRKRSKGGKKERRKGEDTSIHRYVDTSIHQYTSISMHRYIDTMYRYTNVSKYQVPMYQDTKQCTDIPMYQGTKYQCTTVPRSKGVRSRARGPGPITHVWVLLASRPKSRPGRPKIHQNFIKKST